ncbi:MAG: hypothetical protein WB778_10280 [Thermoplasmata archaeon]
MNSAKRESKLRGIAQLSAGDGVRVVDLAVYGLAIVVGLFSLGRSLRSRK